MHKTRQWVAKTLVALGMGSCLFIALVVFLQSDDSNFVFQYQDQGNEVMTLFPEDGLILRAQLREVDVSQGFATITILPFIEGTRFGTFLPNGWVSDPRIQLQVDSVVPRDTGSNQYIFEDDLFHGSFDVTMDLARESPWRRAEAIWYPFDEYSYTVPTIAYFGAPCTKDESCTQNDLDEFFLEGDTYYDDGWGQLPVMFNPYLMTAGGFVASMRPMGFGQSWSQPYDAQLIAEESAEGLTNLGMTVRRSASIKLAAIAVSVLILASAISVLIMAITVASRHRPPTIQALVWGAALTFAILQMRGLYPYSPPLGMHLDYVVYFPSLIITVGCALWILVMWAKRADYQH